MSTTCCWVKIRKRDEFIQNIVKFCSNYRLPQKFFNCWAFILINYQQVVNKITKGFWLILWQFVSRIFFDLIRSFNIRNLHVRFFLCHEFVCNDAKRPDIHRKVGNFTLKLLNWSIVWCHCLFHSRNRPALRLERCTEISYNEGFLGSNKLLENISGLKITVYYFLWVDMVKRDADHCKNSKNIVFWNGLFLTLLNDV